MATKYLPFVMLGCVACSSSSLLAYLMMNSSEDPATGPTGPTGPTGSAIPDIMLEDKIPYTYEAGKLYACTSGKDVGCVFRA